MGGRSLSLVTTALTAGLLQAAVATAQERSAPAGAVIVRPVQVREVRVDQPAPSRHHEERPTFGTERPIDPGFISRPVPRPQPSITSPRHLNRNVRGHRSQFSFKPRFNTGFGVVVGYPVIYPYVSAYGDPFSPTPSAAYAPAAPARNTYSNVDSLAYNSNVTAVSPLPAALECEGAAPCGGVSFDITPASAQVSVDGIFAGNVDEFDSMSAPLLLAPGSHYIEIRLAGYRTASFDVTVASGEVTPYQGTLERLRLRTP